MPWRGSCRGATTAGPMFAQIRVRKPHLGRISQSADIIVIWEVRAHLPDYRVFGAGEAREWYGEIRLVAPYKSVPGGPSERILKFQQVWEEKASSSIFVVWGMSTKYPDLSGFSDSRGQRGPGV